MLNYDDYDLSSLEAFLSDLSRDVEDTMSEDEFSDEEFLAAKWFQAHA
tara:strand:- start:5339 stop:5482 length:144 start_codon:yes stop_codon:yes gene_type:complete